MSKRSWQETDFSAEQSEPKRQKTSHTIHYDKHRQNEMDLLDLVDAAEEIEELDSNTLRSLMKSLNEAITKNQQQRSKFNAPIKFKESEIALNDIIQELSLKLPESPHLYRDFVLMKGVDHLLNLLMHENIDIVSTIIGFIKELTETDNYMESQTAIIFIIKFIQQNGVEILLQNLNRLHDANQRAATDTNIDDEAEDDSQTIFAILSILENISEIEMDFCIEIVKQCKLFKILLNTMRRKQEYGKTFDEIQLYLSELLCIYLQPNEISIYERFATIKGCDKILDLLRGKYKENDPILSEEKEYVSNILDALASALASTVNQDSFCESPSGMNILMSLMKEKNFLKYGCIQALSFALTNHDGNCVKFVENGGLKTIFGEFMNRKKIRKKYRKHHQKDKMEEYLSCALVHLFCNLSDVNLLRLMNKFNEKDYAKIDRLIELHTKYLTRLEDNDAKEKTLRINNEIEQETFGERYSRRLENGLYTLQMVDILIAFVYTFPDKNDNQVIKQRIIQVLNQYDMDIDQVKATLNEYYIVTHPNQTENSNNSNNKDNNLDNDTTEQDIDDMSLGSIAGKLLSLM